MSGTVAPIVVVGLVLGLALVVVYAVRAVAGRRRAGSTATRPFSSSAQSMDAIPGAAGERVASPAAEQIEEMVRQRLGRFPDLAATPLDFGTGPGGELEIWVGESRYGSVEEIPDVRIRQAVAEAVEVFNRQSQAPQRDTLSRGRGAHVR